MKLEGGRLAMASFMIQVHGFAAEAEAQRLADSCHARGEEANAKAWETLLIAIREVRSTTVPGKTT
jgi:hypothetical protein